jgi:hypothetical protein
VRRFIQVTFTVVQSVSVSDSIVEVPILSFAGPEEWQHIFNDCACIFSNVRSTPVVGG